MAGAGAAPAFPMSRAWEVPGLTARTSFREAAGRVIATRWREMMSFRDGTLAGDDPEFLHDMRVASRRLRSAMDAFAAAFPARPHRRHLRTVKLVTDTLGHARDLDVQLEWLDGLAATLPEAERPGLAGLRERLAAERAEQTPRIRALFERLERDRYGRRLERFLRTHTAIDADELAPGPPGEDG